MYHHQPDAHAQPNHPHHHQHYQRPQVNPGQGFSPASIQERRQRKEFLWRERMKLTLQLQGLQATASVLCRQRQQVQARKTASGKQLPKVVGLLLLSVLLGLRQTPAEWRYQQEKGRIAQEEWRLQQEFVRCNGQIAAVQAQIRRLDAELARL